MNPKASNTSLLVISGADSARQLAENPGIYVGRYPIPAMFRVFGHTATAESTPHGILVTELVGLWQHLFQQIQMHKPVPHYGPFDQYRWIKVAELDKLDDYRSATTVARHAYHGRVYTASSNRFVSTVLKNSGIALPPGAVAALGSSPGIEWHR